MYNYNTIIHLISERKIKNRITKSHSLTKTSKSRDGWLCIHTATIELLKVTTVYNWNQHKLRQSSLYWCKSKHKDTCDDTKSVSENSSWLEMSLRSWGPGETSQRSLSSTAVTWEVDPLLIRRGICSFPHSTQGRQWRTIWQWPSEWSWRCRLKWRWRLAMMSYCGSHLGRHVIVGVLADGGSLVYGLQPTSKNSNPQFSLDTKWFYCNAPQHINCIYTYIHLKHININNQL